MNRYLRRVIWTYGFSLLTAFSFVPWYGHPLEPWSAGPVLRYAPFWLPPRTIGYYFLLDFGRLLLTVFSLTLVLLAAAVSLWGGEEDAQDSPS